MCQQACVLVRLHFSRCCWCRSRAEAWRIGAEIAAQVTAANPPPVTLKLEKVRSQRRH